VRTAQFAILLALAAMSPVSVFAITLTNLDPADRKLIVIEGDKRSEETVNAGQTVTLCEKSCVIRVPEGEDYAFDGSEEVLLEENLLALDFTKEKVKPAR
jgi:hypothetical protein